MKNFTTNRNVIVFKNSTCGVLQLSATPRSLSNLLRPFVGSRDVHKDTVLKKEAMSNSKNTASAAD